MKLSLMVATSAVPPPKTICGGPHLSKGFICSNQERIEMKRYVMGNRPDGLSDVLFEDDATPAEGGLTKELWVNYETPANLSGYTDPVADQKMIHEPPDGGACFRIIVIPPLSVRPMPTPEQMNAYHQAIHSAHVPTLEYLRAAKNPTMHKTDTLNYFVLTEGELWALSEGKDVRLLAGDVLIQKGCIHGWDNRSDKRAVMACILIDSQPAH